MNNDSAKVFLPPPLLALAFVALSFGLEYFFPYLTLKHIGIVSLALGVIFLGGSSYLFKKLGVDIRPWKSTEKIIDSGLYAYTRNPIYLGFLLIFIGIGFLGNNPWCFLVLPILKYVLEKMVVEKEERYLKKKFPEQYPNYYQKVPRWF